MGVKGLWSKEHEIKNAREHESRNQYNLGSNENNDRGEMIEGAKSKEDFCEGSKDFRTPMLRLIYK